MTGTMIQFLNKWLFSILGFVILFNYQNCAPGTGAQGDAALEAAMPADVIDHISTGQIELRLNKVVLAASDDSFNIDGKCEDEGSIMAWNLWDQQNVLVEKGRVACVNKSFNVVFEGAADIKCGESFIFSVNLGAKSGDKITVEKSCQ